MTLSTPVLTFTNFIKGETSSLFIFYYLTEQQEPKELAEQSAHLF